MSIDTIGTQWYLENTEQACVTHHIVKVFNYLARPESHSMTMSRLC